ncbi:MAG: tyrosine-type recombinase/integrase [Micropepsaceae bacterium]
MPTISLFDYEPLDVATSMSPGELVAEFEAPYANSSNRRHGIAARHLLCWLKLRKIALAKVNNAVLERFGKHSCRCPRHRTQPNRDPQYMTVVRMFVHMLEQRGVIPAARQHDVARHLLPYVAAQKAQGYAADVVAQISFDARHLAYWIGCNADWGQIDRDVIERFAHHDCSCPRAMSGRPGHTTVAVRLRSAARFLAYLAGQGVITLPPDKPKLDERLTAYCHWLATVRALPPRTVKQRVREVKRWYARICGEGVTCSTEALRSILLDQDPSRSQGSINQTVSTLRSFVRFLIARSECPPDRLAALGVAPKRPAKQVPRYIDRASVEQIIAASDTTTRTGLRDQALILLLARLGLRAGDVVAMQLDDIDWDRGTIRVSGKSSRVARLPLPQDAGEAILAYIEHVRPTLAGKHLFLCLKAPYRPFAGPSTICEIVRKAVEHAGLTGITSGSHVFRHSLATSMLREGSTLEAIGTVLRHAKPDTTAIYAKVDLNMLGEVTQPWIEGASC